MTEFVADIKNPRTRAYIASLTKAGLMTHPEERSSASTSICRGTGLRTDVVRLAEKAADATGQIQCINYDGFTVRVQDNLDDRNPTFVETHHTWVLPDPTRRTAMLATSPTLPQRVVSELEEAAVRMAEANNARQSHH